MGAVRVGMPRKQHLAWSADHGLLHPLWWVSLGLLLLNDHYLKGSDVLTGAATGKLSDFAGMLVAPTVVAALLRARTRLRFAAAHALVGLSFSALKLSASLAELWCWLGAQLGWHWQMIADPSDLVALPLLAVSCWSFGPRFRAADARVAWRRAWTGAGLVLGLIGIVATSRIPPRRPVLSPRAVYVPMGNELQELERVSGKPLRRMACELGGGRAELAGDMLIEEQVLDGRLRACDLARGQMAWQRELGEAAELVASTAQRVLARSDAHVWALEPQTGTVLWQLAGMNRGVAFLDGRLFVRRQSDHLFVLSPTDGARSTASDLVFPSLRPFANIAHPPGVLLAQAEYPDGVDAIDVESGKLLWQLGARTTAVAANTDLVLTHGGKYCSDEALTARAARTGRAIWSIPWCPAMSSVSADRDLVVTWSYGSERSLLVARRATDGAVLWSAALDR